MKYNDIDKLKQNRLPVFSTSFELADIIHINVHFLNAILSKPDSFYKYYTIPKNSGGLRDIYQPNNNLKAIQAWILRNILDNISPTKYATAYRRQTNIKDNVNFHGDNQYFACLDLEDFFPSISRNRIFKTFLSFGYSDDAASILAQLCSCNNRLPQGAVSSPALSNLIAAKLDRRIAGYSERLNIVYSRYADDITLSCNNIQTLRRSLKRIIKIINNEHFNLNMHKMRILGPGDRCEITGLIKNNDCNEFTIGKNKKRLLRAAMHQFIFPSKVHVKYNSESSINGWLNYLKGVDPKSFNQMSEYWRKLQEKIVI